MRGDVVNAEQAAAWAGEADYWARHDERYNAAVRPHGARLLAAAAIDTGDRVLDLGCGCGDSTRQAARRATPDGEALGVDLSARMLERARQRTIEEGLTNVAFEQADAQVHPFDPERFDVALSRFGATFFGDPVAAFTNVAQTLRRDGRLALVAWQEPARNQWLVALRDALAGDRTLLAPPTGHPGMFAFAEPTRVRSVLAEAGFVDVGVEAVEAPVLLGADGDDAFRFISGIGIVRGMLNGLDPLAATDALARLRATLHEADHGSGVLFGSAAWLVTATRP